MLREKAGNANAGSLIRPAHTHSAYAGSSTAPHGDISIVLITNDSESKLRPLADQLARESKYVCYFEPRNHKNPQTFLAFVKGKPVGYLLMDQRRHYTTVPREKVRSFDPPEIKPQEEIWSVVCIWVKPQHQKQGIGRQLCMSACANFNTTPQEIGWTRPSAAGEALLNSFGIQDVRLVYARG